MVILFIGDIVGEIGREAVRFLCLRLRDRYHADLVCANVENVTNGRGMSKADYLILKEAGIDVFTMGNHVLGKKEITSYIKTTDRVVRPMNMEGIGGLGSTIIELKGRKVRISNVLGNAFISPTPEYNAFDYFDEFSYKLPSDEIHIVDFHGESTSEKAMFAHMFDGRLSAVVGTHTHVQTSDAQILPKGTAFISDLGFSGHKGGIIGFDAQSVIDRLYYDSPRGFRIPLRGKAVVEGAILRFEESRFPISISSFREETDVI